MKTAYSLPQLPKMQCDSGCGDCCGIVLVGSDELERIRAVVSAQGIKPRRQGSTCPLYIDGACSVYEARPLVCRLFGHVEGLKCSHGYNVNVDRDTARKWDALIKRAGRSPQFLHGLAYSDEEIAQIVLETITPRKDQHEQHED